MKTEFTNFESLEEACEFKVGNLITHDAWIALKEPILFLITEIEFINDEREKLFVNGYNKKQHIHAKLIKLSNLMIGYRTLNINYWHRLKNDKTL